MVSVGKIPILLKKAKPITPEILMSIHEVLDFSIKSDVVYWCLFLFAFFLFARKSNLVPDSDNYVNKKFLLREDIQICENTLIVNVKWSKTIQFGELLLKIPLIEIPGSILCPLAAFRSMCQKVHAKNSDPLFSLPKRKCITDSQYQSKLREVIAKIGLNPEEYSTHSMRRGGTSFAFKSQVPIDLIKLHGDWKSDCYQKYLSFSMEDKLLVASKMRKCILAI